MAAYRVRARLFPSRLRCRLPRGNARCRRRKPTWRNFCCHSDIRKIENFSRSLVSWHLTEGSDPLDACCLSLRWLLCTLYFQRSKCRSVHFFRWKEAVRSLRESGSSCWFRILLIRTTVNFASAVLKSCQYWYVCHISKMRKQRADPGKFPIFKPTRKSHEVWMRVTSVLLIRVEKCNFPDRLLLIVSFCGKDKVIWSKLRTVLVLDLLLIACSRTELECLHSTPCMCKLQNVFTIRDMKSCSSGKW